MSEKPEATPAPTPEPVDRIVVTKHTVRIGGKDLAYTATAGTIVLKEEREKKGEQEGVAEGEKARAVVFFVAYTLDGVTDAGARPVTFAFNGGPGSSSVWLHLGALGPRRVVGDADGTLQAPPYRLTDNEHTLLAESDLVFIDPVSTGFSRPVTGEKAKDFHTFRKDIESVGDFIRLWCSRQRRWSSPKYLAGESYGTTRSAGLASYLQDRHGMYLNGLMLVSCVLDFQTLEFLPTNDLPSIVYLPAYTATAWYHRRLEPALQEDLARTLEQAETFAIGEYATALLMGSGLDAAARATVAAKVARFTGLSADYVERANMRPEIGHFCRELLRDQRRVVGRLDSRYKSVDRDAVGGEMTFDPSFDAVMGPYAATLNDYVRGELGFESDLPYEILSFRTNEAWKWDEHSNRYVEVVEALRRAMTQNPHLRVFVANGYFDLATPYFATEHTFRHLGLPDDLAANVSMSYYEAGHMMYVHQPSLAALGRDLAQFVRAVRPS